MNQKRKIRSVHQSTEGGAIQVPGDLSVQEIGKEAVQKKGTPTKKIGTEFHRHRGKIERKSIVKIMI